MAELTLDVSDELMQRLQPLQDRLPALLALLVDALSSQAEGAPLSEAQGTETPPAYTKVLDFLLTRPTPHASSPSKYRTQPRPVCGSCWTKTVKRP